MNQKNKEKEVSEVFKDLEPIKDCPLCGAAVCIKGFCMHVINRYGYYKLIEEKSTLFIPQVGLEYYNLKKDIYES